MPIHHLNTVTRTLHHRCLAGCQRAIPFANLAVARTLDGVAQSIATPECPLCRTTEAFRVGIADHELGVGTHPASLTGTRFAETGGIVHEHTHGYSLDPAIVAQKRLARALADALLAPAQ